MVIEFDVPSCFTAGSSINVALWGFVFKVAARHGLSVAIQLCILTSLHFVVLEKGIVVEKRHYLHLYRRYAIPKSVQVKVLNTDLYFVARQLFLLRTVPLKLVKFHLRFM